MVLGGTADLPIQVACRLPNCYVIVICISDGSGKFQDKDVTGWRHSSTHAYWTGSDGRAGCAAACVLFCSCVQAEVRDQHPKVMQLLQEYTAAKAAAMQQEQQQPAAQLQGVDRQTAAVTPLGTCSACPSNHRNVSAYYLDLFDQGGLLMDCGGYISSSALVSGTSATGSTMSCQPCCLLCVPSRSPP